MLEECWNLFLKVGPRSERLVARWPGLLVEIAMNLTHFVHFVAVHLYILFILHIQPLILGVGGLGGPPPQIFPPPQNMAMDFPPPGMFFFQFWQSQGLPENTKQEADFTSLTQWTYPGLSDVHHVKTTIFTDILPFGVT